ncbi:MAG TPA: RNA methyltransferase [Kofleriaceae bacterium]|nr:RNA methyltransferase [Kofleriaceae bacterium]
MSDAIERMIDKYGPDAVCRALEPLLTPDRIARIDAVLAMRLGSIVAAVEDTYDPHNAAATIRTCEALGLQELHVIEPKERFSATKGVTRGAHRWIDLHRWPDATAAVEGLHARGFRVYATLPDAKVSIEDVDVHTPLAVLFGNEHEGVSEEAIRACDASITVPMFGFTESYNLSVTVGLAMSRLAQRRREVLARTGDLEGDLDPTRRARLRARWFALRIRAAVNIVERKLG